MNMDMKKSLSMLLVFWEEVFALTVGKSICCKYSISLWKKFIAQDYIDSLVAVSNDADRVWQENFPVIWNVNSEANQGKLCLEIRLLTRKWYYCFGSNLVINSNDGSNTETNAISTQLNLGRMMGWIIKFWMITPVGKLPSKNGMSSWDTSTPAYSSFRLSNLDWLNGSQHEAKNS